MSIRPFADTLRDIETGVLLDELSEHQNKLIEAIRRTGKAGSLTIVLNYKPEGEGQMTIKAEVKSKAPLLARGATLFFMTPELNLTREDPRQKSLELRSVTTAQPEQLRGVSNV
jgi:hypothetical protein